ncbi:cytochrome c biogenesis protein CcdA [bacterium]|nr:cytochrome c biogenesis protein CcdA [bacterium]
MIDILNTLTQSIHGEHFKATMLIASFFGGVIASVSPCSLAMLPIIIGYIGGYSKEKPFKTFLQMLVFILGTAVVFTAIGIICAVTGKVFISFMGSYFGLIIGSFLIVMGLKLLDILDFEFPMIIKSIPQNKAGYAYLYPFLIGMIFALAGTPCSTPILAGIMAFASVSENIPFAVLMLFLFALGQGIILIIAGVFTSTVKNMQSFVKISEILLKISGALLALSGLYIFYKIFSSLL